MKSLYSQNKLNCVFLEKSKSKFLNPKMKIFILAWNIKRDHSMEYKKGSCVHKDTLRVWILHVKSKHTSVRFTIWAFWKRKGLGKSIFTRGYHCKNQWYTTFLTHDILKVCLRMTFILLFLLRFLIQFCVDLKDILLQFNLFAAYTVRYIWCRFPLHCTNCTEVRASSNQWWFCSNKSPINHWVATQVNIIFKSQLTFPLQCCKNCGTNSLHNKTWCCQGK